VRHSRFTDWLINETFLRPVVLVRNIFDIVPSLLDHHLREDTAYSMAYVPSDLPRWPRPNQELFVARMVMPWLFNFYRSWHDRQDKLVIRYEAMIADPEGTIAAILGFANRQLDGEKITAAVAEQIDASPRKNCVTPGRGKDLMPETIALITSMADYYPELDFTPLGIWRSPVTGIATPLPD
jgi:hypothetical protein